MSTNGNGGSTTPGHSPSSPTSEKPFEPTNFSSATPDIVDSHTTGGSINQQNGNHNHRRRSDDGFSSPRPQDEDSLELHGRENLFMGRQSPEGKDNMIVMPREQQMMTSSKSMDQYSADSNNNGKINVQVTVLFGGCPSILIGD